MNSRVLLSAWAASFLLASCSDTHAGSPQPVTEAPLEAYRADLLDLGFDAVSAMPLMPHVKNRSRAQDAVVAACFDLDQPVRALRYAEKIENWRRGIAYADYAYWCARAGATADVPRYLELANEISQGDLGQEWRRDRIRARIARTHLQLGETEEAARFSAGLADSEVGIVELARVDLSRPEEFDSTIETVDDTVAAGSLDRVRAALSGGALLFDRFYADESKRSKTRETIEGALGKVPVVIGADVLMDMAGSALDHYDPATARDLLGESRALVEKTRLSGDARIPLMARWAGLTHRAGDPEAARAEADAALALFHAERELIIDMFRGRALRPLAEAYHAMGDTPKALMVYELAVDEGCLNVNSRPRAEDLAATCTSLARNAVEPDAELEAKLRAAFDGLGDPW